MASAGDREKTLEALLERIREERNFDFRNYKRPTLRRRIERRMSETKSRNIAEYMAYLDRRPAEYDALISSVLIKVTSFFRDPETWQALSAKAIPAIISQKKPGEELRVWCAGCATGEETYTVTLLLAEALGQSFHSHDVKVFGTDLDEAAIAYARRGIYTPDQVKALPKELLERWFSKEPGGWSVRKELRRKVVFGVNNLVSDAPISRLDMLICRNVFIYLDAALQKRVLTRFHYALRRNGVLVLGKSELIPFAAKIFEPIDLQRRVYRKDGRRDDTVTQDRLLGLLEQETLARAEPATGDIPIIEQFHRDILSSIGIPVIATARDGSVTLWNSAAASLWNRGEAEVLGKKLAGMNLPGLSGDLLIEKTALVREGRSHEERADGTLHRAGESQSMDIEVSVTALRDTRNQPSGLLYVVSDSTATRELEQELRRVNEDRQAALEELQTTNEELQSSNEELETTNEELQSANEELQTTNEELQSTNEELETTNEEMQSTNAELDATNRELAHRTEEMNLLAYYQRTIIRSLAAAVVVLDPQGRITVWNLAAERLLGLAESEAIGQTLWTLHIPALSRQTRQKIRKGLGANRSFRKDEVEYELPNGAYGYGSLVAVPIMDGGKSLGAVILFEDTSKLSKATRELESLRKAAQKANGAPKRPRKRE